MRRRVLIALAVVALLWVSLFMMDAFSVFMMNKQPIFALEASSNEDGCGRYDGLGYHYDIEGHFDDCDCVLQGVVEAEVYLIGQSIYHKVRVFEP